VNYAEIVEKVAAYLATRASDEQDYALQDCADALRGQVGAPGSPYDPHDCRCLYSGEGRHTYVAPDCVLAKEEIEPCPVCGAPAILGWSGLNCTKCGWTSCL
jgi:hypothetical protein